MENVSSENPISRFVRWLAGALLILAAAAKFYQFSKGEHPAWMPLWLEPVASVFELCLGLWLFSGFRRNTAFFLGKWTFAALLFVSSFLWAIGMESCGCFGAYDVPPSWMALMDSFVFIAFLAVTPQAENVRGIKKKSVQLALVVLLAGITIGIGSVFKEEFIGTLGSDDLLHSSYTTFSFKQHIGKRSPILQFTESGKTLEQGIWVILIYRAGCHQCEELLPTVCAQGGFKNSVAKLALIAVPQNPPVPPRKDCAPASLSGSLVASKSWLIHTPEIGVLKDGVVIFGGSGKAAWEQAMKALQGLETK